jgi:hypothetical protein
MLLCSIMIYIIIACVILLASALDEQDQKINEIKDKSTSDSDLDW